MKSLQIRTEDALASAWYAIRSAKLEDIPIIATYLIAQTRGIDRDDACAACELTAYKEEERRIRAALYGRRGG